MKQSILVVDDNLEILDILQYHLLKCGYTVHLADCADKAMEIIETHTVSAAVLDVMMPAGMDGHTLCKEIRKRYFFPILFLTAKSTEDDKVAGLVCGADDYVVKPFSSKEILARITSMIRRSNQYNLELQESQKQLKVGRLLYDYKTTCFFVDQSPLELTDIEQRLMMYLLQQRGLVIAPQSLYKKIWDDLYTDSLANNIAVHIKNIRRKIGRLDADVEYIHTVWGKGYAIYA